MCIRDRGKQERSLSALRGLGVRLGRRWGSAPRVVAARSGGAREFEGGLPGAFGRAVAPRHPART
eukprot:12157313-Alexandrium_andersonii.AAC.1